MIVWFKGQGRIHSEGALKSVGGCFVPGAGAYSVRRGHLEVLGGGGLFRSRGVSVRSVRGGLDS